VSPEIRRYQGFVVKFIGDGLMAVFPTGADAAVAAGIAQFQQLASFNQNNQNNQYPGISHLAPIQIGMGIHTGQVMLGMLGETHRLQGDAISAQVNFAARLEGLTKYFGALLLISQTTYDHLQDPQRYQIRFLDNVRVKGTQRPMGIYEVLDAWLDESYRTLRWEQSGYLTEIIERFTQGDFEGALSLLNPLRIADPQNLTWSLYSQEIKRCQAHGEPWDGVITFDRK
jgi:class 3 adenylate cyclase